MSAAVRAGTRPGAPPGESGESGESEARLARRGRSGDNGAVPGVYDHTQRGTVVILSLIGGAVFVAAAGVAVLLEPDTAVAGGLIAGPVFLVLLLCLVLFHCLRVVVSDSAVSVAFGYGWPRRTFELTDIRSARAVRNSWWYGWGIRLTPRGWMFNVSGLDAVELELANGRHFRIGTDDPAGLEAAIRGALEARARGAG